MSDYRVTHELKADGQQVARIEEWQGVDGPYLAFRYRGGAWQASQTDLLWAMRTLLTLHVDHLLLLRKKAEREWNAQAIREIAWAMASWATKTNWVEVAREVSDGE